MTTKKAEHTEVSDEEVSRVATLEAGAQLAQGEEYIDRARPERGALRAQVPSAIVMKDVLPRAAVSAETWSKTLAAAIAFRWTDCGAQHNGKRAAVTRRSNRWLRWAGPCPATEARRGWRNIGSGSSPVSREALFDRAVPVRRCAERDRLLGAGNDAETAGLA